MKSIKVILHNIDGSEVTFGYLVDEENSIIFYKNLVWLARIRQTENSLFELDDYPMSLLGEQKQQNDLEDYYKKIVKYLKKTSLYDYIVQKHFYSDQDINFDVT